MGDLRVQRVKMEGFSYEGPALGQNGKTTPDFVRMSKL
jgi:hypothetical protein